MAPIYTKILSSYLFHVQLDGHSWFFVMAANLKEDYDLTPGDLSSINPVNELIVAYQFNISSVQPTQLVSPAMKNNRLTVSKCGKSDFQYWVIITSRPALPHGRLLLGELNKIIPVSETRFSNLTSETVTVHGVAEEVVIVSVYDMVKDEVATVSCKIPDSRVSMLYLGHSGDSRHPNCFH